MAGVRTSLTEAQIESRRNHYLEKIGQGKPKAKGTKSNPLKNKDLARMLQERFGQKGKGRGTKKTGEAIAQLNQQQTQASIKPEVKQALTYNEAHQVQNLISDESRSNLERLKANLEAEEAAAKQQPQKTEVKAETPAQKKPAEAKTWKKYLNERGMEYTQPKSGVAEADRRAAEIIKQNEQKAAALRQEALYHAERINKPFTTSAAQIDRQLGMGHKYPVSPNYAEEYAKLMDEKYGKLPEQAPETRAVETKSQTPAKEAKQSQKAEVKAETPAQKKPAEAKTWKKYLNERGMEYTQPKSGVGEADRRAAEIIKKNEQAAARQKALADAERINKPFTTSAAQIDRNLGVGERKYPVSKSYADDYAKLLDEKYGPQNGSTPTGTTHKPGTGKSAAEQAAEKGKPDVKKAVKDGTKKPGFFARIGNAMKGKKGKIALAAAAVAALAGVAALFKGCGDDKKSEGIVAPSPAPAPVIPEEQTQPVESRYDVLPEEGKMPKAYTIKAGDYPSAIIEATYGVKYGTPEYNAIRDAVYAASEYQPNTNIYAGDKFTLPDVEFNGKVYSANPEAEVKPGIIVDNGLKLAHTKEVVKEADKFYIIYKETGEKVPNEPAFDSEDAARARIGELDALEAETEEVQGEAQTQQA